MWNWQSQLPILGCTPAFNDEVGAGFDGLIGYSFGAGSGEPKTSDL